MSGDFCDTAGPGDKDPQEVRAMKFIHTADVHLGAVPDAGMPWSGQRAEEIWRSFYALLDRAVTEKVDLVIISGDLFHRQPLKKELKELDYRFRNMTGIRIILIAGNHDHLQEGCGYADFEWSENVTLFRKNHMSYVWLADLNTMVYGMSYDRTEITENVYDDLRPMQQLRGGQLLGEDCCHILVAHGGDAKHIPIDMKKLSAAGFDYVAMGHIHKPWMSPDGRMAYCGALEPIDCGDIGPHGYVLGEVDGGQTRTRFVPFASREYRSETIEIGPDMTMQEIADRTAARLESLGSRHIYRLTYTGMRSTDITLDTALLMTKGDILSVADETVPDYDFDRLLDENRDNIIGHYIAKIQQMDQPESLKQKALYYGIRALEAGSRR